MNKSFLSISFMLCLLTTNVKAQIEGLADQDEIGLSDEDNPRFSEFLNNSSQEPNETAEKKSFVKKQSSLQEKDVDAEDDLLLSDTTAFESDGENLKNTKKIKKSPKPKKDKREASLEEDFSDGSISLSDMKKEDLFDAKKMFLISPESLEKEDLKVSTKETSKEKKAQTDSKNQASFEKQTLLEMDAKDLYDIMYQAISKSIQDNFSLVLKQFSQAQQPQIVPSIAQPTMMTAPASFSMAPTMPSLMMLTHK